MKKVKVIYLRNGVKYQAVMESASRSVIESRMLARGVGRGQILDVLPV